MKICFLKILKINIFLLITTITLNVQAQSKKFELPSLPEAQIVSKEFVTKVTPTSVNENEEDGGVLSKVADDVLSYWWSSTPLRQTAFVKAAESIEKKAQMNAVLKDSNQIHHVFDFKVLILQTLARIEYKGWFNAGLNYNFRTTKTEAELIKSISANQDLVLSQEITDVDSNSKISLKFKW